MHQRLHEDQVVGGGDEAEGMSGRDREWGNKGVGEGTENLHDKKKGTKGKKGEGERRGKEGKERRGMKEWIGEDTRGE